MEFNTEDLGFRELDRLADFIKLVASRGLDGAWPVEIGYDVYRDDAPYCIDSNDDLWTLDDDGKLFRKFQF